MYCHTCVSWSKLCRHRSPFLSFCFVCGVSWSLLPFFGTNPVGLAESFHDPSKVRHSHPVKTGSSHLFFLKQKSEATIHIPFMGLVYLHKFAMKSTIHVGKYIIRPMELDSSRFSWPRRWSWAKGYGFPLWDLFVNQITRSRNPVEFRGVCVEGWIELLVDVFCSFFLLTMDHGSYCSSEDTLTYINDNI